MRNDHFYLSGSNFKRRMDLALRGNVNTAHFSTVKKKNESYNLRTHDKPTTIKAGLYKKITIHKNLFKVYQQSLKKLHCLRSSQNINASNFKSKFYLAAF